MWSGIPPFSFSVGVRKIMIHFVVSVLNLSKLCVLLSKFQGILWMQKIDFEKGKGLVPVIVQDYRSREVLMVAYMNKQAWEKTKKTGKAHYYSRSRKGLWLKGEESGNFQEVKSAFIDCDHDTLLLQVRQVGGAACHEGYRSCFFRKRANGNWKTVAKRVFDPKEVYQK
jgi:phosphoribosyl-AMP cyclohydrolase